MALISGSSGLIVTLGGATLTALAKAWHADHRICAFDAPFSSSIRAETKMLRLFSSFWQERFAVSNVI